jgi:hypothetical protein
MKINNKNKAVQKDSKRASPVAQILVVLLVLGFLWLAGKSILYFFNVFLSKM